MTERKRLAVKHAFLTGQLAVNGFVGYLFLRLLASRFGASAEKDIFDIAYSIPFVIMNVGGFAFAHAVIASHFSQLLGKRPQKLAQLFATTVTCAVLACSILAGLCVLFAGPVTGAIAPGYVLEKRAELQQLMLLLLPIVFTFSLCTLFSAVSTAHGVPASAELAPLITRLIVIAGLVAGLVGGTLPNIALALVGSSAAALAVQWILVARTTSLRVRFSLNVRDRHFQDMARQALGFFVAACVAQAGVTYMRRLATLDEVGANAAITYALSLVAPFGLLVGKPISLVTGPRFARMFALGDSKQAKAIFDRAVVGCLAVGIAAAALVHVFSVPLVRLLYAGGQFDDQATRITADLLGCLVWSLPGSIVLWAVLMPLIAVSRSHGAAMIYVAGYVLQIAFMALFFPVWGKHALAWGYTLASSFQAIVAWFVVNRALEAAIDEVPLELAC